MDPAAITDALARAGLGPLDLGGATIAGHDPVYTSPHRLGEGAAVARLLTGLAARDLWALRTGRRQAISVDVRHAGAALASFTHLQPADPDVWAGQDWARPQRRLTRIVAAAGDRDVQLHGSFHDGPALLAELGVPSDASAVEIDAAVASRDAFELEQACIRRRICGGVVRTAAEWATHPQGQALADRAVVTLTRLGDAPAEPLPDGDRPLAGVRVVDLTRVLAGPTCAKTLAEHGADVLHVTAPHLPGTGLFDVDTGIGKRQVSLDLRVEAQADQLVELIRTGDVFSQGYRLGTLARRGLAPEQLAELRPGIVCVSENCYGPAGPWAERPGWEQLAQAATGMSHLEGLARGDGTPHLAPAAVNDYTTGFLGAYGAMEALRRRATEGGSWLVEVSLCETAMWYLRLGQLTPPAPSDETVPVDHAVGRGLGDVADLQDEVDTPDYGRLRYLRPALAMSETPPHWTLPPRPAGTHAPTWPPRPG